MSKKELTLLSAVQFGKMLEKGKLRSVHAGKIELAYKGITYQIPLSTMLAQIFEVDDEPQRVRKEKAEKPAKKRRVRKEKAEKPAKRRAKADGADVQTAVLEALRSAGEAVGMGVLKDATGFNPIHIRAALAELVEAGTVEKEGEKRGTVYSVVGKKAKKKKKVVEEEGAEEAPPRRKKRKHREEASAESPQKRRKRNHKSEDAPRKKKKLDLPWSEEGNDASDFDVID